MEEKKHLWSIQWYRQWSIDSCPLCCCAVSKCFLLTDDMWASSWKSSYFLPLMCPPPCLDSARLGLIWQCYISSLLLPQSWSSFGFESSYCCTSGYFKPDEGLWAADLSSGFEAFAAKVLHIPPMCVQPCSCCSPHQEMTHYVNAGESLLHRNTVLNLLNIFAVIYAPLLTAEKLFIDSTLCM